MIPLPVKNFVTLGQAVQYNVGVPWEYVRLRNESDNECSVTFSGSGNATLAAWVQDDFYVGQRFTGQVTITPIATATTTTLQAGFVTGNAYATGELKNPGSIMLVRIVAITPLQANTLSNETNTLGSLVIDMGDPAFANLINIYNDGHAAWNVDRSGVKHQIMLVSTGVTNPIQFGQNGDTAEFLGNCLVDQTLTVQSGNVDVKTSHVISNGGYYNYDNFAVAKIAMFINTNNNDLTIQNSPANGILHIVNSAGTLDVATFQDT